MAVVSVINCMANASDLQHKKAVLDDDVVFDLYNVFMTFAYLFSTRKKSFNLI